MIDPSYAYIFISGLYIGSHTNFFSNIVIIGLVTYIVKPHIFTRENFDYVKDNIVNIIKSSSLNKYITKVNEKL